MTTLLWVTVGYSPVLLAPFIDPEVGGDRTTVDCNPGIGSRAAVRPRLDGRFDIGFGNGGPAVSVGLGSPF